MFEVSVLIASKNKSQQLLKVVQDVLLEKDRVRLEIIVVVGDQESFDILKDLNGVRVVFEKEPGVGNCYNQAAKLAFNDILVVLSDDITVKENWLLDALKHIKDYGLVSFNDLFFNVNNNGCATHFIVTKQFLARYNGGVLCVPCYERYAMDRELTQKGRNNKQLYWAEEAIVEHNHPVWSKNPVQGSIDTEVLKRDNDLFRKREKEKFPNNFEPFFVERVVTI